MNYYTSDLHFGHDNIMKYENRPGRDINEMNKKPLPFWRNIKWKVNCAPNDILDEHNSIITSD